MFGQLQRDTEATLHRIIELVYFMRGSVSYEEMLRRTYGERQRMGDFIERRIEVESKRPFPMI